MIALSRTWKTLSAGAFKRKYGVQYWWDSPEASPLWRRPVPGKYLPPVPRGVSAAKARFRRRYWHSIRQAERAALMNLEEPDVTRTRHSICWDMDW